MAAQKIIVMCFEKKEVVNDMKDDLVYVDVEEFQASYGRKKSIET